MLLAQMITAILLWLSACSGFVDPPPVDPPDTLAVEPAGNHAPEIRPEAPVYDFITAVNHPIVIGLAPGLLTGMIDPDGDPMATVLDSMPLHGTMAFYNDGRFTYTPDADFTGGDRFYFSACDPWRCSETVYVTILVNTAPVARPDTFSVAAGDTLRVSAAQVLANDFDVNGHGIAPIWDALPTHGEWTYDGHSLGFTYVPSPGFTGVDELTYHDEEGSDTGEASVPTTVTILVTE